MNDKLDYYHYHELLDRTAMVASIVEEHLLSHIVADQHPTIHTLIEEAQSNLMDAYTLIGSLTDNGHD